jgi:hypothetical protein
MMFEKDSAKDRWGLRVPCLIWTTGYYGGNQLHDPLAAMKQLQISQLLLKNLRVMWNIDESVHAFIHVLAFITQDARYIDMFMGINIFYALNIPEMNYASRADIEGITCIFVVFLHVEPETGLLESGIIAVTARKLFEWK